MLANVVGVHLHTKLWLKIDAQVRAKALARAEPAQRSRRICRIAPAFNRDRHRDIVRRRLWHIACKLNPPKQTMDAIVAEVAHRHGLMPGSLTGPRRSKEFVVPRFEAIYLIATERPDLSYPQIGAYFSRDHTSILNAVRQHAKRNGLTSLPGRKPI